MFSFPEYVLITRTIYSSVNSKSTELGWFTVKTKYTVSTREPAIYRLDSVSETPKGLLGYYNKYERWFNIFQANYLELVESGVLIPLDNKTTEFKLAQILGLLK